MGWLLLLSGLACSGAGTDTDTATGSATDLCGDWSTYWPSDSTIHVASGSSGGDGSVGAPFASIDDALSLARSSDRRTIAIDEGSYATTLALTADDDGLLLCGRGSDRTELTGTGEDPVVQLAAAGNATIGIAALAIRAADGPGLLVDGGAAGLEELVVGPVSLYGIGGTGAAQLDLDTVSVTSVSARRGTTAALNLAAGAVLTGRGVTIDAPGTYGVFVTDDESSITLDDFSITGATLNEDDWASGVMVFGAATAVLSGGSIADSAAAGAVVQNDARGTAAMLALTDVDISGLTPFEMADPSGVEYLVSYGVEAYGNADVSVIRGTITDAGYGVIAVGTSSGVSLDVDGTTIVGEQGADFQGGIALQGALDARVTDVAISGAYIRGILVQSGAALTLVNPDIGPLTGDLIGPLSDNLTGFAYGLGTDSSGTMDITGGRIHDIVGVSASFWGGDSTMDGTEICCGQAVLSDAGDGPVSFAVGLMIGANAFTLKNANIHDQPLAGIVVIDGAEVTVKESTISGIFDSGSGSFGAVAYSESQSTTLTIKNSQISDSFGSAVLGNGALTTVALSNSEVSGIRPTQTAAAAGVQAWNGAHVSVDGVTESDIGGFGLLAYSDDGSETTLDATETTISAVYAGGGQIVGIGAATEGYGARVTLTDATIDDVDGPGLYGHSGSLVVAYSTTVTNTAFAGAVGQQVGGVILEDGSLISGVQAHSVLGGGFGGYATSIGDAPGILAMEDSTVEDTRIAGVYLKGPGYYVFNDSTIEAGSTSEVAGRTVGGNCVFAGSGVLAYDLEAETGLLLQRATLSGSPTAAVLLDDADAYLWGNTFSDNAVDLVWQDCAEDTEPPYGYGDATTMECPTGDDWYPTMPTGDVEFALKYQEPPILGSVTGP